MSLPDDITEVREFIKIFKFYLMYFLDLNRIFSTI